MCWVKYKRKIGGTTVRFRLARLPCSTQLQVFLAGACPQPLQGAPCQAGRAAEESGGTAERNHQPLHLVLRESWLSRAVRHSRTDSGMMGRGLQSTFPGPPGLLSWNSLDFLCSVWGMPTYLFISLQGNLLVLYH